MKRPEVGSDDRCCVVRAANADALAHIRQRYEGAAYVGVDEQPRAARIRLDRVVLPHLKASANNKRTNREREVEAEEEGGSASHKQVLFELQPPRVLPNGNVGTPGLIILIFFKLNNNKIKIISHSCSIILCF